MRSFLIIGTILLAIGALILVRGMSFSSTHDVVKVGDVHVTDTDSHQIPQWVGIGSAAGGLLLIGAGAMKRS